MRTIESATPLAPDEWTKISGLLVKNKYYGAVEKLSSSGNTPLKACVLFEGDAINQNGQDAVNEALRRKKAGFRLTTIGSSRIRYERLLAFVRWEESFD